MATAQDDQQLQDQNIQLRQSLSDAVAAIQGSAQTQTFAAVTFEGLAAQQLANINGADTQARPNELNAVQRVLNNVVQAVTQIKAMPPEAFADPDPKGDVNTTA